MYAGPRAPLASPRPSLHTIFVVKVPGPTGTLPWSDLPTSMSGALSQEVESLERDSTPTRAPVVTVEQLFRQHGRDVYRIVRRLMGSRTSPADVEDLVQQVFLAAHRDLPRYRGESSPRSWLYGIASRVVLMHFRGWRRRLAAIAAFADATRMTEAPPPTAEATVGDRQELRRVQRALDTLKPEKRVVFVLHELEGLPGKEISVILGIPEPTVFTRLYYARRELLAVLAGDDAESPTPGPTSRRREVRSR